MGLEQTQTQCRSGLALALWRRQHTKVRSKVLRHLHRQLAGGAQKVLATLHHQGHALSLGRAVQAVLNERRARPQALRHDQVHCRLPDVQRHAAVALKLRVDPEGLHILAGGVDVQDVVGRCHHRAQLPRATQLRAVLSAIQPLAGPDAVHVVHQLPALEGPDRVKTLVGLDVGETQRQRASPWPHTAVQQVGDGRHAADLIAVGQRIDQHVRTGLARLEAVHVVDANVALTVGAEVARQNLKLGGVADHGDSWWTADCPPPRNAARIGYHFSFSRMGS